MPDPNLTPGNVPESKAVPRKRTRLSFVWIIPIVAAAAGIWITVTKILSKGPDITIVFQSGDGLEANKTKIEYNGIKVGTITAIHLTDDRKHVIATAEMSPKAEDLLVKDTRFWVVKPRISGLNITGLGTLISGYYIGLQIGESKESERHFTALEVPPLTGDVPGRVFTLKTPELGSLGAGTPIYFRQLPAGQVVSYELDSDGKQLSVKIFVQAPYDQYVNSDTRFWQASGIDVSLSANGLHVQTESVMSILAGGIAFETPVSDSPQPPAAADTVFNLFESREDAFKPASRDPQSYLLVFNRSVRGLTVGAPVVMGGVPIGEVTGINPQFNLKTMEFSVPVTIKVDPARNGVRFLETPPGEDVAARHRKLMDALVAKGLRAELKSGNLLSGSLLVTINFVDDAPPASMDWAQNPPQFPTVSGKLEAVEESVASLLKNLDQAVVSTRGTLTNADTLLLSLDQTLGTTRGTLTNADRVLNNAGTLISPDSILNAELLNLLQQGSGAAQSLRVLADYLERHPEALIRGKTGEAKP